MLAQGRRTVLRVKDRFQALSWPPSLSSKAVCPHMPTWSPAKCHRLWGLPPPPGTARPGDAKTPTETPKQPPACPGTAMPHSAFLPGAVCPLFSVPAQALSSSAAACGARPGQQPADGATHQLFPSSKHAFLQPKERKPHTVWKTHTKQSCSLPSDVFSTLLYAIIQRCATRLPGMCQ